ncbi:glucokinase [Mariniphaga anaerophila]|uniref:Glucokinase n=1 Tax=Mariniphaga anaerophila TaxID=1484053 RepID=A0A1M5APX9_9BACT|nr:ROK family protein [Mariniphaga anaerophila]SHF32289.1 glucokinase [Mariniphaga anaerophila]
MNGSEKEERYAVGIDLEGLLVRFALVSEKGNVLYSGKLSLGRNVPREVTLSVLHTAIHTTLKRAKELGKTVLGIGIGTPGIVYNGVVLGGADNINGWKNIFLHSIFSKAFNLPVFVDNDANVMGFGEVAYGAARGNSDVVFLLVGTGIGGAVVIDGKLFSGFRNRGAELGHITINYKGVDCNCGGRGCLEAYASTEALIRQYIQKTGRKDAGIDGHYIVQKYHERETAAVQCIHEHTRYLGHGVASMINIFAPEKVVIGGGISDAGSFYIDLIEQAAFEYAMPDCTPNTEVVAAGLGNQAGCLGAASLVFKG